MRYGICSIRFIADLALILSFPILIGRIIARGNAGVSLTSQVLHLLVFLLRYTDLGLYQLSYVLPSSSVRMIFATWGDELAFLWTPLTKVYLICAAASVLVAMGYRALKDRQTKSWRLTHENLVTCAKTYTLYLLPVFLLAYRLNYTSFGWLPGSWRFESSNHTLVSLISEYFSLEDLLNINERDAKEVAWAASIYLAAIADIPQYKAYYRYARENIDWWLMSSMALLASWRLLYIGHWIARYLEEHIFDTIAFIGAIVQVFVFWMFFVLVVSKVNNVFSEREQDLEAQLAEYDSSRWGEEETQVLLFTVDDEDK